MTWQELVDNKALRHQAFLWEENGHTTAYLLTEITEKNGIVTIVGRSMTQSQKIEGESSVITKNSIIKEFSVAKDFSQPRVEGHRIIVAIPLGIATFSTKNI